MTFSTTFSTTASYTKCVCAGGNMIKQRWMTWLPLPTCVSAIALLFIATVGKGTHLCVRREAVDELLDGA